MASAMAGYVMALKGRSKKCIVVDLDNTLWGGVVGDDGPDGIAIGADGGAIGESFERFQRWLKALGQRGIVLAVCSKNDLAVATRSKLIASSDKHLLNLMDRDGRDGADFTLRFPAIEVMQPWQLILRINQHGEEK